MLPRIVIDGVRPTTTTGRYPAKAVVGETVPVSADIFRDGHDILGARVRWRPCDKEAWETAHLRDAGNDRWEGEIQPTTLGLHEFVIEAWTDSYATWRHKVEAKLGAGQDITVELEEGARLMETRATGDKARLKKIAAGLRAVTVPVEDRLVPAFDGEVEEMFREPGRTKAITTSAPMKLWVDRERALFSAWYELFPRSEGGLAACAERLPAIVSMGFDIVYLPPIHPIGRAHRKGANNTLVAGPDDPGSPWAIGGREGGHTAIHPDLGTFTDFEFLVEKAGQHGLEIALDYALQCSPDHPWVDEHPEWFHHRPDGSIAYAENPPKKYQDIYPINFWPEKERDRVALWDACRDILLFWIARGVRVFRVDNPHTKPTAFWEWLIPEVQRDNPDVLFLAEAFTRPKVMAKLAEVGFTQSYTYFTWRNTKAELTEYGEEVANGPKADFMRPNFWPNTPDILSGPLRNGPISAFRLRALLAATMVPSWGMYSGYELGENEPYSDTNEEYLHSEKYEIKHRDWANAPSIAPFIALLNGARRCHPALQRLRGLRFHYADNDAVLAYSRVSDDGSDVVLVVASLDVHAVREATLGLDLDALGIPADKPFDAYDELSGQTFPWWGPNPYVRIDPSLAPGHLLHLRRPG